MFNAKQHISPTKALKAVADNPDICAALAKKLEIQADGGDEAADFVKYCLDEVRNDRLESAFESMLLRVRKNMGRSLKT